MITAAQHTTKSFYDRIAKAYDLLSDSSEHTYRERGLTLLTVRPGERALEIGFGTGHSLVWLAQAVGPTGKVSGVDISDGMCEVATRRAAEAGVADRIDLHVAPAPPLNWPDGTFDLVNLSFTLELFPLDVIPKVLAEIRRVLKPGGRMGTVSMAKVAPGEKTSTLEWTYQWSHRNFPHIVDCQPIDAEGLIRAAGFKILASERLLMWTMPVAAVVGGK
jgi:ubiquinone/menaquinone biosynthesis C-methylase UbiE